MHSLNACMHPRNIYKKPLNFEELCHQYPELLTYINRVSGINADNVLLFRMTAIIRYRIFDVTETQRKNDVQFQGPGWLTMLVHSSTEERFRPENCDSRESIDTNVTITLELHFMD